jgi:RNA 2',3'-cyclic 3'-phosphodiesterase
MRRIFVAITLDKVLRCHLAELQEKIRPLLRKGRFTNPELLHLTIQFLGSLSDDQITRLIDSQKNWVTGIKPFDLQVTETGLFNKRNKSILWAGVKADDQLFDLAGQINETMALLGFREERPFRPHITLAREAVFVDELSMDIYKSFSLTIPAMRIKQFDLMESRQEEGRLNYRSLSAVPFE